MREFKTTALDAIANFREGVCRGHIVRPASVTTSCGESRFRRLSTLKVAVCLLLASLASVLGSDQPKVVSFEEAYKGKGHGAYVQSIVFFQNKLYGEAGDVVLEITNGAVNKVYQLDGDRVLFNNLWHDSARDLLWVLGPKITYYDGHRWQTVKFPKPKHGYFSREDFIERFRFVSNSKSLWLQGAGRAWRWEGPGRGKWLEEVLPEAFHPERVPGPALRRLIPAEKTSFLVKCCDPRFMMGLLLEPGVSARFRQTHPEAFQDAVGRLHGDEVWCRAQNNWNLLANKSERIFTTETTAVNDKGYIQTHEGYLFEVTETAVSKLDTPGFCEAIVNSGSGTLLASFRHLGIFELKDGWRQLLKSPYPEGESDYRIYLAAQGGQIAFCLNPLEVEVRDDGKPIFDPVAGALKTPETATWIHRSTPGLWISSGGEWKLVPLRANQ